MRRFYKEVATAPGAVEGGYTVLLDGRCVHTPGRERLEVRTVALAEAIAGEWGAQASDIVPDSMPLTQLAATALDRVKPDPAGYAGRLAAYAETDLVCYRAPAPTALVTRQARLWQPLVEWAAETLAAPLTVTEGIVPQAQSAEAVTNLRAAVDRHDVYELAALGVATAVSGSVVIALALSHGRLDAGAALEVSHVDETFQAEQWGRDEDVERRFETARRELATAERFLHLHRAA